MNISGLAISTVMIALFFLVLRRSIRRVEMRWWTYGWLANAAALLITTAFWYAEPPVSVHGLVFAVYLVAKAMYVWLLLRGALEFRGWRPHALTASVVVPAVAVSCLLLIVWMTTRDRLGVIASAAIALGFGFGAFALARARVPFSAWIVIGFGVRGLLGAMEAAAYGVNVIASGELGDTTFSVPANALLAAHYPLDTAAEWLLAMGCVIGLSARAQSDLEQANQQMLEAQAGLRQLADRDPLTLLANRRALPEVMRAVQPRGAALVFFDLDDFKRINDEHGHQAGDQCLVRFAAALTQSFRPTDAIVRYAGDEFLVVASGLDGDAIFDRVEAVRYRVHVAVTGGELPIRFSYGVGQLAPGGNPDEALKAADEAMYRAKPS